MRYGPNFIQSIDESSYDDLPEHATYEGDAKDLQHLIGRLIPTRDVENVIYVGEREQVWVEMPDGSRRRPWYNCWIHELDGAGKVITKGYGADADPIVERGENAMSAGELSLLGFTDDDLRNMAKEELGEVYNPDRNGPSDLRRSTYDRVMAKVYG